MNDKILYRNEWLDLRQKEDGYIYSHEVRCNGQIVAFLIYTTDTNKIVLRQEVVPPWSSKPSLCAFTGGVEKNETPFDSLCREVEEEAGVDVKNREVWIDPLGTCRAGKSNDTIYHLFWVECRESDIRTKTEGDGTGYEKDAENILISDEGYDDNLSEIKDSLVHIILYRANASGDNEYSQY